MNRSLKKWIVWSIIAIVIFSLFRWLFGIAIPDAALAFSTGITTIIMAGLLSGYFTARIWYKSSPRTLQLVFAALIVFSLLCFFLIGILINKMIEHTQFNYFFFTVIALFLVNVFIAMIIGLVRNRLKTNAQSLAQSKAELNLIQAQFSPHFLFNTLNNLYGLSLTEHQKIPELILKLSDLLRYSVYETKQVFVSLSDEVNYLKNYIEFEKIRLGERLVLSLEIGNITENTVSIAPLLLITFVENAFKHSKNTEDEKIYIEIEIKSSPDTIYFLVRNSCTPQKTSWSKPQTHSGFGLESVKKRLDLLYLDRHELNITNTGKSFTVTLVLKNKKV